jgi:hypothetical protein
MADIWWDRASFPKDQQDLFDFALVHVLQHPRGKVDAQTKQQRRGFVGA